MNFGEAIEKMKVGEKVTRKGWNGKGMYVFLVEEKIHYKEGVAYNEKPFIVMFTAEKCLQPGWLASQADILAEDWEVVG
jgi:hypothetical protein